MPRWDSLRGNAGLAQAQAILDAVPNTIAVAALVLSIYLIGCIATPLQLALGRRAVAFTFDIVDVSVERKSHGIFRLLRFPSSRLHDHFQEDPRSVTLPVENAMMASFAQAGAPALACQVVPFHYVMASLESTAVQLCEKVPLQAEEYDRLKSESEFRGGVALPLGVLLGLVSVPISPFLFPIAVALPLALTFQAHQLRQQSRRLLAVCLHLGYSRSPLVDGLIAAVKRMNLPEDASSGTWSAAIALAATYLGDWEMSTQMKHEFYPGLSADDPENVRDFLDFEMTHEADGVWLSVRELRKYDREIDEVYLTAPEPVA